MGSVNPFWEQEFYASGKFPRAPYDAVASFVYRRSPAKPRAEVRVLEVGCGAGNNVWFLASEGFSVAGSDGSQTAIDYAHRRFVASGLTAELRVEAFPKVSFEDRSFDLVIERAALVYVPYEIACQAIEQIQRVLVPGGRFFFNPYSYHENDVAHHTCFWNRTMIDNAFARGWKLLRLHHSDLRDELENRPVVSEWRVEVEKV